MFWAQGHRKRDLLSQLSLPQASSGPEAPSRNTVEHHSPNPSPRLIPTPPPRQPPPPLFQLRQGPEGGRALRGNCCMALRAHTGGQDEAFGRRRKESGTEELTFEGWRRYSKRIPGKGRGSRAGECLRARGTGLSHLPLSSLLSLTVPLVQEG